MPQAGATEQTHFTVQLGLGGRRCVGYPSARADRERYGSNLTDCINPPAWHTYMSDSKTEANLHRLRTALCLSMVNSLDVVTIRIRSTKAA